PPMRSLTPYSSSDQRTGSPTSAKVWLNAGRWPSRSVSARTPSQSKISAGTRLAGRRRRGRGLPGRPEDADVVLRHLLDRRAGVLEQRRRVVLGRGGVEVLAGRVGERDLERGRDVDLRAAARDQVG